MSVKKLKYSILEKLQNLPKKKFEVSKRKLPIALNISNITFSKWLYIKVGESAEIKISYLRILANFFNCTVEELCNETIKEVNYDNIKDLQKTETKTEFKLK